MKEILKKIEKEYKNKKIIWTSEISEETEVLEFCLDDEKTNLNIRTSGCVVVFVESYTHYQEFYGPGPRYGYKDLECNINSIFSLCGSGFDSVEFFFDGEGNIRGNAGEHDFHHAMLFRAWRAGITKTQKESFIRKYFSGEAEPEDFEKYTRSIARDVCRVYGWPVKRKAHDGIRIQK